MKLTLDQVEALKQGQPIQFNSEELGEDVVVLSTKTFKELCESREEAEDLRLRYAWHKATQRGLALLLKDEE